MARVSGLAWYVLVHQLPPRPLYLRAKIRQRLARVGAIALKSSVYVLPRREDCLEDLEWIAEEARSGNGEAWIGEARFVDRKVDEELVRRSRAGRNADYRELSGELRGAPSGVDGAARLARARKRLQSCEDFEDLMLLRELDSKGRVPGTDTCSIAEALEYIRSLESEAYLDSR